MKLLRISLLLLFIGNSSYAKCKSRGGDISATACVSIQNYSVESDRWSYKLRHFFDASYEQYGNIISVTPKEVTFPLPAKQRPNVDAAVVKGKMLLVGASDKTLASIKENTQNNFLIEEPCLDEGDPGFRLIINADAQAHPYNNYGEKRVSDLLIECK